MFVVTSANIIVHVSAAAMLDSKVWGYCLTHLNFKAWSTLEITQTFLENHMSQQVLFVLTELTSSPHRVFLEPGEKEQNVCKPSQVLKIHILTFIASFTVRPRLCKSQFLLFYCTGHRPRGRWAKSNQFLSRLPVWGNRCRPEMENFKLGIVLMKMYTGFPNPR